MRKELEAFIEESFAGLPPSPETEQAKAQVRKQLEADAAVYRRQHCGVAVVVVNGNVSHWSKKRPPSQRARNAAGWLAKR